MEQIAFVYFFDSYIGNFNRMTIDGVDYPPPSSVNSYVFGDSDIHDVVLYYKEIPTTCLSLFKDSPNLIQLDFSKFNSSLVTSMSNMFYGCTNLTHLDLSPLDACSVTDMSHIFSYCAKLTSINLLHLDTSNVTNMGYMFSGCSSLYSINLSSLDTSNVIDMEAMFRYCNRLSTVKMSGDVSKVNNTSFMFEGVSYMGTFTCNPLYDYSKVLAEVPSTWTVAKG